MRIARIETWKEPVPLTRPYSISSRTIRDVELFFVRVISEDGDIGLGSASPAEEVTGEANSDCEAALEHDRLSTFEGRDLRHLTAMCRDLESSHRATPAARVAVEMALYDLASRALGLPLVEVLGRCHDSLPTSITIGIKESIEEALEEADEYLDRGFVSLKVKIGRSFEEECELLERLDERLGTRARIRVDANLGYTREQTLEFWPLVERLDLELVEQPVPVEVFGKLDGLPGAYRRCLAADESLQNERDAIALAQDPPACGIFNIKLMKCGGLSSARTIARIAEIAGLDLMWGCMDESAISISAALHTAYSCPNTRYLDLDGSFDLARDPALGGFELIDGQLRLMDAPGLGVELSV